MKKRSRMFFADSHSDIPYHLLKERGRENLLKDEHLPTLYAGGVDLLIANIYTHPASENPLKEALLEMTLFWDQVHGEERLFILTKGSEIEKAFKENSLSIFLSLEGLEPLGEEPLLLKTFYQLGVRLASLTWNHENHFARGVMAEGGLTPLGREVLALMEELGMILDLSHLNEEGFWEALEVYSGPLLVSHSNVYSLYNHPRNLNDDQLEAVAERGGVIGLNNYMTGEPSSLDTYMEHLYYLVKLLGEDHVGLGFDFNSYLGLSITPGMEDHRVILEIGERMERGDFSSRVIEKVLGGNILNFLKENL